MAFINDAKKWFNHAKKEIHATFSDEEFINQSKAQLCNEHVSDKENQPESYKLAEELVNAITIKLKADAKLEPEDRKISESSRAAAENMRTGLNTAMAEWRDETIDSLSFSVEKDHGNVKVICDTPSALTSLPAKHNLDRACKQTIESNAEKMTSAGPLSGLKGMINKIAKAIGFDKPFQEEKTHLGNDETISKDIGEIDDIKDRSLGM